MPRVDNVDGQADNVDRTDGGGKIGQSEIGQEMDGGEKTGGQSTGGSEKTANATDAGPKVDEASADSQGEDIITVKPDAMDFDPSRAHLHHNGRELFVSANTTLGTEVDLSSPATSISIYAYADRAGGDPPKIFVSVDGTLVGEITVYSTEEKKYYLPINADPGHVRVELTYPNDYFNPDTGKDRNLYIANVKIHTQGQ